MPGDKNGRRGDLLGRRAMLSQRGEIILTDAQTANMQRLANALGVTCGPPMSFLEANEGRANHCRDDENCAACVAVHELRLRGLNVTALPYDHRPGSLSERLAKDTPLAWLDERGRKPQHTALLGGNAAQIAQKLARITSPLGSRYLIGVDYNQDSDVDVLSLLVVAAP